MDQDLPMEPPTELKRYAIWPPVIDSVENLGYIKDGKFAEPSFVYLVTLD